MATGPTPSVLAGSVESNNTFKLMRLILDGGTEALRSVFRSKHPGNLQVVLSNNKNILANLKKNKIILPSQWNKLYPSSSNQENINEFDISLLSVLLRNICNLSPPNSIVWTDPSPTDFSVEADVTRIRILRNERFAHIPNSRVSEAEFKKHWTEVSGPLLRLGIDQKEIDRLENEEIGHGEIERLLKLWKESEREILGVLKSVNDKASDVCEKVNTLSNNLNNVSSSVKYIQNHVKGTAEKEAEIRSNRVLKRLVSCDFAREIEFHSQKLTEGTREWVFEKVSAWFYDETSENRAFVISGVPGMGKSVIAAVLCKMFADQLGASHFFQFNNSQYNNPSFLLQSIAWQLCKVFPSYKVALVERLSGRVGKALDKNNTEGLFTILLKEPLTNIKDPGTRLLIVLDALDESEYYGRKELADLIANHFHKLPSYIRFAITTRPEKNLMDKFNKLNPLLIETSDERNLRDVKIVIERQMSSIDMVNSIAKASDGLMLYASLLSEYCKNASSQVFRFDCFPNDLRGYYGTYFKRLEEELTNLEISEAKFLSFLNALAAAREPLPFEFIANLFELQNRLTATRKLNEIFNSLSSLLIIREDQTISPFHKSLSDWLVDPVRHNYTADVKFGHQLLFDACCEKLDDMKKKDVRIAIQKSGFINYAIKHCTSHMLNAPFDLEKMNYFVVNHVGDVESLFASVLLDVDITLDNIICLMNHDMYKSVLKDTCALVTTLYSLIKKFAFVLRDYPQTFFQHVVNEGGYELSSKALTLLQTRYQDIIFFELVKKRKENDAVKARFLLSGKVSGIDVSPKHDYVVCSYGEGGIELFSSATAKSEWRTEDVVEAPLLNFRTFMLPHCIVFHPNKNLILPGRLDQALNFEGTIETGPFQVDEAHSKFTNCCFSPNGRKLVTNYGNDLLVWDTLTDAEEMHLSCKLLQSFSFTGSGHFLGTIDVDNIFSVYDVTMRYSLVKHANLCSITGFPGLQGEIISISDKSSWITADQNCLNIIGHDLLLSGAFFPCLTDIVLPGSLYHFDELKLFLRCPKQSWFPKLTQMLNKTFVRSLYHALRYILLDNNDILVFSRELNVMHIFDKNMLDSLALKSNGHSVFSNISNKGDYVYFSDTLARTNTVYNLESKVRHCLPYGRLPSSFIPVVRDGVISYGENYIPQLWNSDLSQCLANFDQLVGAKECLSVSEELIACVYESSVIFFNVSHRQVEQQIDFLEPVQEVKACSVKYDALVKVKSMSEYTFWKNGGQVEGWTQALEKYASIQCILFAHFSPDGDKLAMSSFRTRKVVIFDVTSETFLSVVFTHGPPNDLIRFQFYDNENLVCGSQSHMVYLINASRGEILTCLDIGEIPRPIYVCPKKSIVYAGRDCSENFELIKVSLPRTV